MPAPMTTTSNVGFVVVFTVVLSGVQRGGGPAGAELRGLLDAPPWAVAKAWGPADDGVGQAQRTVQREAGQGGGAEGGGVRGRVDLDLDLHDVRDGLHESAALGEPAVHPQPR